MSEPLNSKKKKKKPGGMFNYLLNAVDKVFYQVYDGEPLQRNSSDSIENILEEEVIFCKNNVCVKVKSKVQGRQIDDIAGYINMKKVYKCNCEYTDLILSWVPNKLLSSATMEEAEIMLPPMPVEQINPSKEPSKYSSESLKEDVDLAKDNPSVSQPDLVKDFDSPLGNVFGINIINMKTVKLFFSCHEQNDAGQFVIGSTDNEYKVFYFDNGGLNKLVDIFDTWNGCTMDKDILLEETGQKVYYIKGKENTISSNAKDTPAEEGRFKPLNMHNWMSYVNPLGQIEDSFNFRKHVFYAGLSHEVRPDAWKFLLYYYPFHSTRRERELLKEEKTKAYEAIHNKRLALSGESYETFWKNVQFTVDKDVIRTDRSHPYYAGQDNPNVQKMRNILLNYAIFNPSMGYCQGMSDLVAPVLATLHDEVDCFWCFVGLMESSMFATTPRDDSMDKSLNYLRELLRLMDPDFYMYCLCADEDLNLLFAHRWLVLCFKREFISHEVLKIWEACWSRYQTDYYHIFICVAMVSIYGRVCIEKKMDSVEILQYFTEMATKFDGSAVLKESRSLLYKFRQFSRIPCTLRGLLSYKGVWDGGILPEVECISHHKKCCKEFEDEKEEEEDSKEEKDTTVISNLEVEKLSQDGIGVKNAGKTGETNDRIIGDKFDDKKIEETSIGKIGEIIGTKIGEATGTKIGETGDIQTNNETLQEQAKETVGIAGDTACIKDIVDNSNYSNNKIREIENSNFPSKGLDETMRESNTTPDTHSEMNAEAIDALSDSIREGDANTEKLLKTGIVCPDLKRGVNDLEVESNDENLKNESEKF